ncbi:MAG: FAD-dependent oxidoreductase [Chloroflexota bacterium]|nr:FAD-dependent oxidoreductase [Chloroflexota bacterium]
MHTTYQYKTYPYRPVPEQLTGKTVRHPVIVIGAGPTGLTAASDLARKGIDVVVLDAKSRVSEGSRAICFAKRSLEVFDRLGVAEPMRAKGVTWNTGKVFFKGDEVYQFNLLPEEGHAHPAFINLQQYYVEQFLIEELEAQPNAEIRWLNRVVDVKPHEDHVRLTVETPDGQYETEAEWVIAADGVRSVTREKLGLDFEGIVFEGKFLITDVVMKADFPPERWFWFDPPFGSGHSMLLHSQPDNVWRIDIQLGPDADPEEEKKPERVIPRIQAMLGEEIDFDLEWVSVYTFHSRRLDQFVHGRVLFAGDSAHIMSPFGARGANSGIQDADNLVWKLNLVMEGKAPYELLESYNHERLHAAKENLLYTESSTEFISPDSPADLALRDAVLELAQEYEFARPLINSGRLSTATVVMDSPLNTSDSDEWNAPVVVGGPCADAPVQLAGEDTFFLKQLGDEFVGLLWVGSVDALLSETHQNLHDLSRREIPIRPLLITSESFARAAVDELPVVCDGQGLLQQRYDATPGTYYLVRPDQYVCARWRKFDLEKVRDALARACCLRRDS